ncbi:MAG: AraC family transcriptional regulator [Lachnospiraceae bacterium]|nr:AraC family transcriptional regulator [Lachnospiraceae bacterium]
MGKKRKPKLEFRYYQMPPGSPVLPLLGAKWIQEYGNDVDYLHFHNFMEIGYCYKGVGTLTLGEEVIPYTDDEFSIIPKNCPHTTNSVPGSISHWEYLFIDVEGFLPQLYADNPKRAERMIQRLNAQASLRKASDFPEIAKRIVEILNVMRHMDEFYLDEAKGLLAALLAALTRLNPDEKEPSKPANPSAVKGDITSISRALDYISDHYMEPLRVEDLANLCHISETHFRRIFSSYMKMGPLEYINTVRIQAACEYLKKTDHPISDIAHKCGFPTISTFNRNFKQSMKTSPLEWRKRPENFEQQLLKFEIHSEEGW